MSRSRQTSGMICLMGILALLLAGDVMGARRHLQQAIHLLDAQGRSGEADALRRSAGSLVKLTLGTMSLSWVRPPATLNFPAGVAVRAGRVYVANNSVCPSFPTPPSGDPANPNPCAGVTGSIVSIQP